MATALKKTMVGFHNIVIRDYGTGLNSMMFKLVESVKIDLTEKVVTAKGGASRDAYSAAIVDSNGKVTVQVKEMPNSILGQMFHNTATENSADATSYISSATNVNGTSVMNATTGITATPIVGTTTGNTVPKEGVYRIQAMSATTVNIYASTDIDGVTLADETTGLVNAAPLTITTSGALTEVIGIGIKLVGGSGAIGMTVGDSAQVTLRRANVGSIDVSIGLENLRGYKEVFLIVGENEERDLSYYQFYKCNIARGAMNTPLKDYHTWELDITPIKDPNNSGNIGKIHRTDNV